jgi:hypothetical protein
MANLRSLPLAEAKESISNVSAESEDGSNNLAKGASDGRDTVSKTTDDTASNVTDSVGGTANDAAQEARAFSVAVVWWWSNNVGVGNFNRGGKGSAGEESDSSDLHFESSECEWKKNG